MSNKKTTTKNEEDSGGLLPKVEIFLIFIFFTVFITWTMSKCSSTQEQYAQESADVEISTVDESTTSDQSSESTVEVAPTEPEAKIAYRSRRGTVLYVLLDGLKLRRGHHLDSTIVKTLKLNEEVYFLNEVSDFKQKINLGDRIAYEPWIKVRAYSGHEGWVYGAGVHYFKPKRSLDTLGN
ncbi:MAG: SH3 domain-containing protein [Bacteroidota bacterium]